MLLGIAYHIALSFAAGFPWLVRDSRQHEAFTIFQHASHGFRMPLFFLISGFFTAMLWRKRGVKALLAHRFRRILLPCLLGLVTVAPITFLVGGLAIRTSSQEPVTQAVDQTGPASNDLWSAALAGDSRTVAKLLDDGANIDARQPSTGVPALTLAAFAGQVEVVELLLERGANVNGRSRDDDGTALHVAAFLGHARICELLLEHGADPNARNRRGETPRDAARVDWPTTKFIAGLLRVPVEEAQVMQGRKRVLELLEARVAPAARPTGAQPEDRPRNPLSWVGPMLQGLMTVPVFHHLWFLWFLWWLVVLSCLCFRFAEWRGWNGAPPWLVLSSARWLWWVPLTMLFQAFMGAAGTGFGPDTSIGLLPIPQVFLYYTVFFAFGILYYEADDAAGRVGRGWRWVLPLALLVVFPLGLELSLGTFGFAHWLQLGELQRPLAVALQALYAWLMVFGCMGLFRSWLKQENRTVRWLSDSAYWLYVAHLPLVILGQLWVRHWPLPALVKFLLLNAVIVGFLLLTYRYCVRYTWIGRLLNGPRVRPMRPPPLPARAD